MQQTSAPVRAGTPDTLRRAVPLWPLPALLTLAIGLWRIDGPSYWRDESVGVVAGHGSLSALWAFLHEVDAVHGVYYAFLHLVTFFGTDEITTRLPSVLAMAAASAGIAVLGRRLISPATGLYGGLLYGLLPITSRYAQEVRQYALVSAGAVLATYLLVRALESDRPSPRWYLAYGACMGLLGWFHLYALFLLSAHLFALVALPREKRLRHTLAWLLSVLLALAMVLPLVLVARGQEGAQVSWLSAPPATAPYDFGLETTGSPLLLIVLVALAVLGVIGNTGRNAVLLAAWPIAPLLTSIAISLAHPVYHPRYVLYCVCGLALAAGAGLELLTRRLRYGQVAALAALTCAAALTVPTQLALREPHSRPDDLRSFSALLRQQARPGDAVVFIPAYREKFVTAYADAFTRLHSPGPTDLPLDRFRAFLDKESRIWVVEVPPPGHRYRSPLPRRDLKALQADKRFTHGGTQKFGGLTLTLYERRGPGRPAGSRPARHIT
ncbi:glycosyltransferase family 39 protein [Actinomadura macrotermitis]|uniref:Glycosyltransferase RgtA/B/C/D-like domain-containing protein n=1 Tax=Actinomadura macrotermitis TaxID=2585200 RepID=A0A7K0BZZ8_9ACTN|nr:glycosyltransferase family 39 protein [Actinomadura macrotermitis]MQY06204.1 hypothetical protein [Actinomadura macrotermitis]